ncbi:MAG: hypothetical protein ABI348_06415 [Nitrososphaera sp.]
MRTVYLPPNVRMLSRARQQSIRKRLQKLAGDLESEASVLDDEIMKSMEQMDYLQSKASLASSPALKEKFRMQLEIVRAKKESDYAESCELKSDIVTLNYYLEELDVMLGSSTVAAVDLPE